MALFRRTLDTQADAPETAAAPVATSDADSAQELQEIRALVEDIQRVVVEVADRGMAQDKVFDTLHAELQDYKNDFIYEHLKPVLWPLLFLFDSLEQYAREVVGRVNATGESQVEAKEVLDHLKFFRGQLVESLRICEVTPMKQPQGAFDPKLQKPIGVETTEDPSEDNTVRRVVRTGWYLNGKVLRHAEVVVAKLNDGSKGPNIVRGAQRPGPAAPEVAMPRASSDASAMGGGRG
jgi:molecular chaperone GrpE